jgi:putative ABC transport system substrate-binding protein
LAGAAIAWRRSARAQRRSLPLVAFLSPRRDEKNVGALRRGLHGLGYVEGQNIALEARSANGDNARLPNLAAELAALKPDVIVTNGEAAIRAVRDVAGTIPIVMAIVDDPVALGFAQSLGRPGGNLTGLTIQATDVLSRRLQILHEAVPEAGCIAVLGIAGVNYGPNASRELTGAAKALGVALLPITVTGMNDFETGFAEITSHHCRALLVMSDPLFIGASQQLIELSSQNHIAASYDNSLIVDAGGLMSYGPDTVDMFRRSAHYVDKILKGEKPANLPIEQPEKFQLVINLKAAQALGLAIPQSILARADHVIE